MFARYWKDAVQVAASGSRNPAGSNNTTGGRNTATGVNALFNNTSGGANTATGLNALLANTGGNNNTGDGVDSLESNTTGNNNTASGNTAIGYSALYSNTTGSTNTASGDFALYLNTTGDENTASGAVAAKGTAAGGPKSHKEITIQLAREALKAWIQSMPTGISLRVIACRRWPRPRRSRCATSTRRTWQRRNASIRTSSRNWGEPRPVPAPLTSNRSAAASALCRSSTAIILPRWRRIAEFRSAR